MKVYLSAEEQEAWRVAAQRRAEARRYYIAWQVASMRARDLAKRLAIAEAAGGDDQ